MRHLKVIISFNLEITKHHNKRTEFTLDNGLKTRTPRFEL